MPVCKSCATIVPTIVHALEHLSSSRQRRTVGRAAKGRLHQRRIMVGYHALSGLGWSLTPSKPLGRPRTLQVCPLPHTSQAICSRSSATSSSSACSSLLFMSLYHRSYCRAPTVVACNSNTTHLSSPRRRYPTNGSSPILPPCLVLLQELANEEMPV